jgi:hypothetical protein
VARSVDDIFLRFYGGKGLGEATYDTAQFLYNSRGKNLNTVAQEYLEAGGTTRVIRNFLKRISEVTNDLIKSENIEGELLQATQKIIEMAKSKQVLLDRRFMGKDQSSIFPHLDLKKVDDTTYVTESLKFANCILQVYSGEAFFREDNQEETINEKNKLQNLSQDLKESQRQQIEENIDEDSVYNFWSLYKDGYKSL